MLTPMSRSLDMLLLMPKMPLSPFSPNPLSKLLLMLKALSSMPPSPGNLNFWCSHRNTGLNTLLTGSCSSLANLSWPLSTCLLAKPTYPLAWECGSRGCCLHLVLEVLSVVSGIELAGRQCLWRKDRKAVDTDKLHTKLPRDSHRDFSCWHTVLSPPGNSWNLGL